ncbi:MAG: formylglycine-generating enzyme family protein [Methylococcaceae bacterium]|nr:formylglycine-generating enzyme family protein [Methylococcaceae bacterium]
MPRCTLATDLNEVIHRLAEFAYADDLRAENWQAVLNHGLDLSKLSIRNPTEAHTVKDWHIVQRGQNRIACVHATPPPPLSVATLTAHLPPVYTDADGKQQVLGEQPITLPAQPSFTLKTATQQLTLCTLSKPGWANRIWRDKLGVFVGVEWCGNTYTLPWRGDWEWDNSPVKRDRYGVYADLTINRVTQRLRWIEAGTFLMGSPLDEPERSTNELQHQVTLSQGYWLADTACTQALWVAVMGNNPARFKEDNKLPVERVSWGDVQEFISKLNDLLPDAYFRLPTEAEWEYACRAGTTTAFSFGDTITIKQVNYDGNFPYRGTRKGLYRQKTVTVKSLLPNAWGLYEMHGNVWEWCADWYGAYPNVAVTDPSGATEGVARVLRGGSWLSSALYARSANRRNNGPASSGDYIGFRLALGQPASSQPVRAGIASRF